MNRKALGLASSLVGVGLLGCGGGGGMTYPDARVDFDAQPDGGAKAEVAPEVMAMPMAGAGSKQVVKGEAMLIGSGADSCTNQEPAPGDRWCAFTRPGTTLGFNELWVINVSKAAAGTAIKCDTSDASCVRLSTALFEDFDIGFRLHGFDGDTLIYYEEPTHSADGFVGVVKAWRPGFAGGRRLTSDTGVVCAGHKSSAAALCFENVATDAADTTRTADLHAGFLTDSAGGLLPKVDSLLIAHKDDAAGVRKWRADLAPDGVSVAWSTRATATGLEILKVQRIGDDAGRATVAEDVSQWTVSADGTKWLWLKKYNYDQTGAPAGTLESAVFPAGTGVTTLAAAVGEFSDVGAKGVLFRTKMKADVGDLMLMPDRAAPATVAMLDTGVLFVFDHTKDGTKAVYTKNAASISAGLSSAPIFDLYVAANDGNRPCTLAATPIAFLAPDFLGPGGDFSAWGRLSSLTGEVEGMATTIATCSTKKFATEIFSWTPVGQGDSKGYVFLDELSLDPTLNEATLRFTEAKDGAVGTPGTKVHTRAQFTYAPLLPTLAAVIYNVSSGGANDGLWLNATLPFATMPVVPPPDGGAAEVSTTPDATAPGTDAPAAEAGAAEVGTDTPATVEAGTDVADSDAGTAG